MPAPAPSITGKIFSLSSSLMPFKITGPADALFDWLHPEDRQPAYDPLKNPVPPCPGDFPLLPSGYT